MIGNLPPLFAVIQSDDGTGPLCLRAKIRIKQGGSGKFYVALRYAKMEHILGVPEKRELKKLFNR